MYEYEYENWPVLNDFLGSCISNFKREFDMNQESLIIQYELEDCCEKCRSNYHEISEVLFKLNSGCNQFHIKKNQVSFMQ